MRRPYPRNDLHAAFRFFRTHAGYSTPPGRAQCALDLARASIALDLAETHDQAETRIEDDEPIYMWAGDEHKEFTEKGGLSLQMLITVRHGEEEATASSGGIGVWTDTDPYLYVVRAELAAEAFRDLAATLQQHPARHGSPVAR